jgi:hypothetical protein
MRIQQWTVMAISVVVLGTIVPQAGLAGASGGTAASARIQITGDPTPIDLHCGGTVRDDGPRWRPRLAP